jgi:hypothetical protein
MRSFEAYACRGKLGADGGDGFIEKHGYSLYSRGGAATNAAHT